MATTTYGGGWPGVTDVPCPRGCGGTLRWAEAGYVPGYRICDLCEARYLGDPASGRLTRQPGRARRVTAARRRDRQALLDAARRAQARCLAHVYGDVLERADRRGTAAGGSHGACLVIGEISRALSAYAEEGFADDPFCAAAEARYAAELAEAARIEAVIAAHRRSDWPPAVVECLTDDAAMIYAPHARDYDGWVWRDRPLVHLTPTDLAARRIWR